MEGALFWNLKHMEPAHLELAEFCTCREPFPFQRFSHHTQPSRCGGRRRIMRRKLTLFRFHRGFPGLSTHNWLTNNRLRPRDRDRSLARSSIPSSGQANSLFTRVRPEEGRGRHSMDWEVRGRQSVDQSSNRLCRGNRSTKRPENTLRKSESKILTAFSGRHMPYARIIIWSAYIIGGNFAIICLRQTISPFKATTT